MAQHNTHPSPETGKPFISGKKEAILAAALYLFTTRGFHATPTSLISKEAGISTGTLFHYFPDKKTLFDQVYLMIKKDLVMMIRNHDIPNAGPEIRLRRCFQGFITWGSLNPEKVRFLEQLYHSPRVSDEIKHEAFSEYAWMMEIVQEAIRREILRDLPLDFYMVMIPRILFGILSLISSGETGFSDKELTEYALDMIWYPVTGE